VLGRAARLHPHVVDLSAAAVIFAVTMEISMIGPAAASDQLTAPAVALAAVSCGVLGARRRYPVTVLVISVFAAEACLAQTRGRGAVMLVFAPLIALYTVADISDRRGARLVGGLAVLALVVTHMLASPASWLKSDNLALAALGGMALAVGVASRNRRSYLAEVERRAQRAERISEQAERTREQEARRRVTEERLRIAHDLHDSVGHHLALINVQSGVAGFLLDTDPDQVRAALAHVATATRSALEELHATVGLLREPGDSPVPTRPVVGLTGLGELIAAYRRSGLAVDHQIQGTVRPLPPAADLTAYRVIQESLTNVCKHAGSQIARLQLSYQPDALSIVIDDDGLPGSGDHKGRPQAAPAPQVTPTPQVTPAPQAVPTPQAVPAGSQAAQAGHGIVGMRERVAALGGEFHAGPRQAGGFRVSATLPLASQPA
jgi:signal transduction histidine kinase